MYDIIVEVAISNAVQISRDKQLRQLNESKKLDTNDETKTDINNNNNDKNSNNQNNDNISCKPAFISIINKFKVAVAIDFGTDGTGVSFVDLRSENCEPFTNVNWDCDSNNKAQSNMQKKTCILLNSNGKCIAFGDVANDKYLEPTKIYDSSIAAPNDESIIILNNDQNEEKWHYTVIYYIVSYYI